MNIYKNPKTSVNTVDAINYINKSLDTTVSKIEQLIGGTVTQAYNWNYNRWFIEDRILTPPSHLSTSI